MQFERRTADWDVHAIPAAYEIYRSPGVQCQITRYLSAPPRFSSRQLRLRYLPHFLFSFVCCS